jgi:hypothetical protein
VKRETRRINRNSWDTYISNIEYDVHKRQETAYKILRELNKTERDKIQLNPVSKEECSRHFKDLWTIKQEE